MAEMRSHKVFDQWAQCIRPKLIRLAVTILHDREEAEDIVQMTILELWKEGRYESIRNLDDYASRAVWLNAIKKMSRRKEHLAFDEKVLEIPDHRWKASGKEIGFGLTAIELEKAIAKLPISQQTVIRLRFYGDKSYQEIGHALSISLNTAASQCRYAILRLRKIFSTFR